MNKYIKKYLITFILLFTLLTGCTSKGPVYRDINPLDKIEQETGESITDGTISRPDTPLETSLDLTVTRGSGYQNKKDANTIMIYMVGSDLESGSNGSEGGCASNDLIEIMDSGIDTKKNNVLVYTGGSLYWQIGVPADQNCVLRLEDEENFEIVGASNSITSMGEPQTLTDFLNFAVEYYPAEHYSLIFWDHGGGPLMGFGVDELFDGDGLLLSELDEALGNSAFGADGAHLDWMGFDACLMGTIEVAGLCSKYADYLVASEELEPGFGWHYGFLSELNTTSDPEKITKAIVDYYGAFYDYCAELGYPMVATLACYDLDKADETLAAMDNLFYAMSEKLEAGDYSRLAQLRNKVKAIGLSGTEDRSNSMDLVDLGDLAKRMNSEYATEADKLLEVIDELIFHEYTNQRFTSGVSVYYPYDSELMFEYAGFLYETLDTSENYKNYIDGFTDVWMNGKIDADWKLNKLAVDDDKKEYTMQLSEEQLKNLSSASFTILEETIDGVYSPILDGCLLEPDENGVLHVDLDQELFFLLADGENAGTAWPFRMMESTEDRITYNSFYTSLASGWWDNTLGITVSLTTDKEGKVVAQTENLRNTEVGIAGKTSVDISVWNQISRAFAACVPTYSADGQTLLPWKNWERASFAQMQSANYEDGFSFEKRKLSELADRYVCQIIVETTTGETYASELVELARKETKEIIKTTAKGELTYRLYEDHAEMVNYTGKDVNLKLPAEVEGKPLTKVWEQAFKNQSSLESVQLPDSITQIQWYAFSRCSNLKKIVLPKDMKVLPAYAFEYCESLEDILLPEGLQMIGGAAFSNCSMLAEVELPEGLEEIGKQAFMSCYALENIHIPTSVKKIGAGAFMNSPELTVTMEEDNKYFNLSNGVLYTEDEKTLVAVSGKTLENVTEYVIPDGVEEIMPYAFNSADLLEKVTFPEGLKIIGESAFNGCALTGGIELPESLEEVGHRAFSLAFAFGDEPAWTVSVGENLSYIGQDAFKNRYISEYVVDEKNKNYASVDGFLTGKNKNTLLAIPSDIQGTVTVPEGVVVIWDKAFPYNMETTELNLPDSLMCIRSDSNSFSWEIETVNIGKNLSAWEISDFANAVHINIDEKNPYYASVDDVIFSKDMSTLELYLPSKSNTVYEMPEGVEILAKDAFQEWNTSLEELIIPSTVNQIEEYANGNAFEYLKGLKKITVLSGNKDFCERDGMLCNADGKVLFSVPRGLSERIEVPEGIEIIEFGAFGRDTASKEIVIPKGVKRIEGGNFFTQYPSSEVVLELYLPDSLEWISESDLVGKSGEEMFVRIHCGAGTYAEQFVKEHGLKYVIEK